MARPPLRRELIARHVSGARNTEASKVREPPASSGVPPLRALMERGEAEEEAEELPLLPLP
jgi:hypothetical protein